MPKWNTAAPWKSKWLDSKLPFALFLEWDWQFVWPVSSKVISEYPIGWKQGRCNYNASMLPISQSDRVIAILWEFAQCTLRNLVLEKSCCFFWVKLKNIRLFTGIRLLFFQIIIDKKSMKWNSKFIRIP